MKEDIKYHGLRNQGATCYLNCILQVLFMTREFREAIESCSKHHEDGINVQLNTLFESLKEKTSETTEVTKMLRIENVYEQQDAGQYLEKILSDVSDEASKIFRGKLIQRTVCGKCGKPLLDDDVPFLFLSLPLMDSSNGKYSVKDGIEEFLKDVKYCGKYQLYCNHCMVKCDTTIKYELECHPEILILLLKRFEYNYNHMSYSKDNRPVDVCYTIDLPKNQTYELYALVDHCGTLTSGHYTARIKPEGEDRWYEFNDSSVTLVGNQRFQKKFERSQSAHLLFYRKRNTEDEQTEVVEDQRIQIDDNKSENEDTGKMTSNYDINHNPLFFSLIALLLLSFAILWIVVVAKKILLNEFILFVLLCFLVLAFYFGRKALKKTKDFFCHYVATISVPKLWGAPTREVL